LYRRGIKHKVSSDLGGEVAIANLGVGMYSGLDKVGVRIWDPTPQEPQIMAEIQSVILAEYDVDPASGKRDVLALLQQLADKGLIEVKDETSA
jgi:hypothetical protein